MIGGMIGGIGSVVDMGIDNAQASQPYQAMTSTALNPGQEQYLNALYGQVIPQIGQPGRSYGGQRVANTSPLQQQGFGMAGMAPQMSAPIYGNAMNMMGNLSQSPNQMFQPAMDAAFNMFQNRIRPDIMNQFASTGSADSGMAQQTLGRAGQDLSTQLAGQLAGMQQQGYANQIAALPQMQSWTNYPTQLGAQMASLGGMQRGIGQEQLDANMQRYYEQDPARNPWLAYGQQTLPTSGQYQDTAMLQQPISQGDALKDMFDPFGLYSGSGQNKQTGMAALGFGRFNSIF